MRRSTATTGAVARLAWQGMSQLRAARELRAFLRRHGSRTAGSAAVVVESLRLIVPTDCLAVSAWDPAARRHRTLATSYPGTDTSFFDDEWHHDPLFQLPLRRREPVRIRDLTAGERHGAVFDRVIDPAGFREGVTQCLYASDGRYVGMVNANSQDAGTLDDDVVHLLDLVSPDLAAAIDPVTAPSPLTARLADVGVDGSGIEGFLLAADGRTRPLSPGARPALAAVLPPTDALPDGTTHLVLGTAVIAVDTARSGDGTVVLHREVPPPDGLTVRELHVLALVAEGHGNIAIGQRCGISARTVATHVEHILRKTGARNRAEAASRAARLRLVVRA